MKKYLNILKDTKLFDGIALQEIDAMLGCLNAQKSQYKKGEYIFSAGDSIKSLAVLVEGKLHIQKDDYWGNRSIMSTVEVGEMFGEAYAAKNCTQILNDVVAIQDSTVIFFDVMRILTVCSSACKFHSLTVQNLFYAISEKNRRLVSKLNITSKRTTRQKLLSYLSEQAKVQKSAVFCIPFNRQQLADFLCVDRSAMSNELCKLRDEGRIKFNKNKFELL